MSKEIIAVNGVPEPIGPYSIVTKLENLIFTSGQLGIDPKTGEMPMSITEQTKLALTNVKIILESSGSSLDKVLKATVFMNDMNDFNEMNEAYSTFFTENYPTRSAVEVARLPKDALVEIEVIATT